MQEDAVQEELCPTEEEDDEGLNVCFMVGTLCLTKNIS